MRKTCENCYNNVRPTIGRILPTDECLEHNPDYGQEYDTTKYWEANGEGCPKWHEKMRINGKLAHH